MFLLFYPLIYCLFFVCCFFSIGPWCLIWIIWWINGTYLVVAVFYISQWANFLYPLELEAVLSSGKEMCVVYRQDMWYLRRCWDILQCGVCHRGVYWWVKRVSVRNWKSSLLSSSRLGFEVPQRLSRYRQCTVRSFCVCSTCLCQEVRRNQCTSFHYVLLCSWNSSAIRFMFAIVYYSRV